MRAGCGCSVDALPVGSGNNFSWSAEQIFKLVWFFEDFADESGEAGEPGTAEGPSD